jgi:16S rRNA (cytidine1402-2'-O)-methyltransferase
MQQSKTQFYIVATPIGNLEDITHRALRILNEVDTILCEDTRVTRKLLKHYNIETSTESYHAQASDSKEHSIIRRINEGLTFALVSDAGTPTISDPGVRLIARIWKDCPDANIQSIPGASAIITGITTTGFVGNQFTFYGFLPHKKGRNKIFDEISESRRMGVFYESPHRLMKTLAELDDRFGENRNIAVGRELTKMFEETVRGSAHHVHQFFIENPDHIRGECVLIIDK